MRNRIFGFIALILGVLSILAIVSSPDESSISVWACTPIFIIAGAWQLFTGKSLAPLKDFIMAGKVTNDDSP